MTTTNVRISAMDSGRVRSGIMTMQDRSGSAILLFPSRSVAPLQGGCHRVDFFMGQGSGNIFLERCPGLAPLRAAGT